MPLESAREDRLLLLVVKVPHPATAQCGQLGASPGMTSPQRAQSAILPVMLERRPTAPFWSVSRRGAVITMILAEDGAPGWQCEASHVDRPAGP